MMNVKFFAALVLLALSLLVGFFLRAEMTSGAIFELVLLIIGIVAAVVVLLGMWVEMPWSWPAAILLFSAYLANLVYLFYTTNALLLLVLGLLINVGGLVFCMLATEGGFAGGLETYDTKEYEAKAKRKGRKR